MSLTVACVLRSGGEYTPEHVIALRDGVRAHLPVPHDFVCLTDTLVHGVWTYPLRYAWRGWWSKIELFQANRFKGRVVYFDLDTVIVGDLTDIASEALGSFVGLGDFNRTERFASGVMAWTGDYSHIYDEFRADPDAHMERCGHGGDQVFIGACIGNSWQSFQSQVPGQIVSYKIHCRDGVPDGARVVCAHGRPKPWDAEWHL